MYMSAHAVNKCSRCLGNRAEASVNKKPQENRKIALVIVDKSRGKKEIVSTRELIEMLIASLQGLQ